MNDIQRPFRRFYTPLLFALIAAQAAHGTETPGPPYQATGFKIGEVTDTEARVWTRLTRAPERVGPEGPMPRIFYPDPDTGEMVENPGWKPEWAPIVRYPRGVTDETLEGAVPGAEGLVRVRYKAENGAEWNTTSWMSVESERDFTRQFRLAPLTPNTRYRIRVETQSAAGLAAGQTLEGGFRTAPSSGQTERVLFTVSTGQRYDHQDAPGGYKIYEAMLALDPSFFIHTGDIVYFDDMAKTLPLARWHWARTYSLPTNIEFHRQVASYFIKDDHDTWKDDCWPGQQSRYMGDFTFQQGQALFLEQTPVETPTYRTVRWGKDLQLWFVEGRDYRSPNTQSDGPKKTIWGAEQKAWFKRTVLESDATFRILVSPTPLVGPDRANKRDNHANKSFQHEGDELRRFIAQQDNMVVICGDRHWQYVSVHQETGVREYSCGPASNEHAGGWRNDQRKPEHQYLNVTGGFLAVTAERINANPTLTFRHYSVDGDILNEDRLMAN